jgi:phosphoribosylanthranilate isomerase
MIGDIQFKVCGLTRAEDVKRAVEAGADFIAFNLYPKSPRHVPLGDAAELARGAPHGPKRVAVMVEPTLEELDWAQEAGFDRFQIHARADLPLAVVRGWSEAVGARELWLAPKLPPGVAFPADWLPLADTFLVDTYHAEGFGGSGKTGDWSGFAALKAAHPDKTWVLAGGLSPDNVAEARRRSGARLLDVNSGVESAPGVKDAAKLRAWAAALKG